MRWGVRAETRRFDIARRPHAEEANRIVELHAQHEVRFPVVVNVEDVTRGKSDPEGFRRGLELLGIDTDRLDPGQVVVVEDSPSGIAAGHALEAFVIGCSGTAVGADVQIEGLGELLGAVDG